MPPRRSGVEDATEIGATTRPRSILELSNPILWTFDRKHLSPERIPLNIL